ncbi:MAG: Asp-tRNA(Asn)/Glu-tRNA(Gln) amidotransferase subunit GatA [Deltaproteobacteria bacterium]|nr:Asp-tRNA(Asn)/Glu-tRNA(Gln) amidotransferase subunit GatA [Deltaproteobacteria bacterium]
MSKNTLFLKTVTELKDLFHKGEVKALEITQSFLERIKETNPTLNSFITVCEKEALLQAENIDLKFSKKEKLGNLAAIPLGIKDILTLSGVRTTCGSKILENFVPYYDATVIEKLKKEDAIFLGKLNMDEFAMGSSNENSYFGSVKNPWDLDYVPGGSSGGSAAALAAFQCSASLGTDTGGSIRLPASYCGVVGLKPTYGRVSRFGLVAFASSLDQIGPFTRTVRDCALISEVMCGHDPKDSTSSERSTPSFLKSLGKSIKGLKIGLPQEYFQEGLNKEVQKSVHNSLKILESQGAYLEEVSLPHTQYGIATYYLIATSEASSNLARFDGVRYGYRSPNSKNAIDLYFKSRGEGFGSEVKRRIMLGTFALSAGYYDAYYKKAGQVRTLIKKDFEDVFKKVDLIVTPTAADVAFKLGEKIQDPLQMYLTDVYTTSLNLAGLPGLSLPCGFSSKGLPIGLQMISPWFEEERIFEAAFLLESELKLFQKGFNIKV